MAAIYLALQQCEEAEEMKRSRGEAEAGEGNFCGAAALYQIYKSKIMK